MSLNNIHNERELLALIAEGDEQAFTILFDLYLGKIKPFVEKMSRSQADAKEIIQLTFVQLWLNRDKLPDVSNLSGYIFKIAANQYQLSIRHAVLNNKTLAGFKAASSHTDNFTEQTIRFNELKRLLNEAISQLPDKRKEIFTLSRNHGMTVSEIAKILNISPKTVKNTLNAALASIRKYLAAAGELGLCFFFFWII